MKATLDLGVERDPDGYLMHPDDWNEDIAKKLASEWSGLTLDGKHFEIIEFMRRTFAQTQIIPDVRDVTKYLTETREMDKKTAKQYLFDLFPHGYMQQGCQVAGMRRPRAWSVG
ncbi:MAG TPA: sulfite reductase subunit gamma [Gammaproteobacteria bacterium]|nr:sulfite reductase subunit gamma [Gammaproteobacteria bacterium]